MKLHPDRNPGCRGRGTIQRSEEAYEALSDPEKRQVYDQYGHEGLDPNSGAGRGAGGFGDIFGDVFGDIFGGGRGESGGRRGPIWYNLALSLEQAVHGDSVEIRIPVLDTCEIAAVPRGARNFCEHLSDCKMARVKFGYHRVFSLFSKLVRVVEAEAK